MKRAIAFFIQHPLWANSLILLTFIFGLIALSNLGTSFFPEQVPNQVFINVLYPGASPAEMEEGITVKIEEALRGINDIDEIQSNSTENRTSITVIAYENSDMDNLLSEVKNAVDGISSFPEGAEKPIVFKQKSSPRSERAVNLALVGDVDNFTLKKYAEEFEDRLIMSDTVSQVEISGLPELEISVEVNEDELLRYNLLISDLVTAIRMNNRDISSGNIKSTDEELIIRARNKTTDPHQIEKIPLRTAKTGEFITINDVATVKLQFAESPVKTQINGKNSINITVKKLPTEDLKSITLKVKEEMKYFNQTHNRVKAKKLFMFYDRLNERIELLLRNGLIGLVLVIITLGLFLNARLSAWVAFGIPFSFLGMFIIGYLNGMTINMISLFGMILVVGILVDDGIVIAENIYSHYERGKQPFQAAYDGTVEVASSVFTSVITTIIAFSVMFFIDGMQMLSEMAFVVIASLGFSMIEAFLILPAHLASKKVLKDPSSGFAHKIRSFFNRIIEIARDNYYGYSLKWLTTHPRFAVSIPLLFVLAVSSLLYFGIIRTTFFPSIPFDDFNVEIAFIPGNREDVTETYLNRFNKIIWEVSDEIYSEMGDSVITYTTIDVGTASQLAEFGGHAGQIRVSLDIEGKSISSFEVADRVRKKIGLVPEAQKFNVGGINRWGKPVSISVSGKNTRQIKAAKDYLSSVLRKMPDLTGVTDNSGVGEREIIIHLKPEAYLLGLNTAMVMNQVREGFFGSEAQRLIIGRDEVKVWVRYPPEGRKNLGQMENIRIKTPQGLSVPLKEIANYEIQRGEVSIRHYDGIREVLVESDLTDPKASVPMVLQKIKKDIIPGLLASYPNISIEFRGQQRNADKSRKSTLGLTIVALFIMFMVIALNFNSVSQAFIIILMLPLGFMGAVLGHGIENLPISILSFIGIVALLGILVNDAVVYLDTYNRNLLKGMSVKEAIYSAGISRFRPIVLTSATTVAGLYPLILEKSFQAQFLIPMATSVAYGVLFGTFFILLFFPVVVLIMNDVKRFFHWLWTGEKCERIDVEPVIHRQKKIKKIDLHLDETEIKITENRLKK